MDHSVDAPDTFSDSLQLYSQGSDSSWKEPDQVPKVIVHGKQDSPAKVTVLERAWDRPTIRRDQAVVKQATLSLKAIRTIQWIWIRNNLERFLSMFYVHPYLNASRMLFVYSCFPICKHLVLQSSSIHPIWKNKNRNYNSINNISDWGSFGLPVLVWT